jgi:hypothetical protein
LTVQSVRGSGLERLLGFLNTWYPARPATLQGHHADEGGMSLWEASKQLGMSVAVLEAVYGHWHPDFGGDAPNAR